MNNDGKRPLASPPVSSFQGPVAELIAQGMLSPPARPGLLANLDQFEILSLIGAGGMGIVLLARDSTTGSNVAIKLIRSDLVENQSAVHRFLKEAGHLKRLRHANIVPLHEISDRANGPYFVMPHFKNGSLANKIKPGQPMDPETIVDIGVQVAQGLSFAHRRGIIHCDLKPANILLSANGQACIADFGLARSVFNDSIIDPARQHFEGTAPYMSPALAVGDAEDTRCDIYSFGALLYEMLTGNPPYKGRTTKEILDQIIAGPPKPIISIHPKTNAELIIVAQGCMAKELRDRYADMPDVVADLTGISQGKQPLGPRGFNHAPLPRPVATTVLAAVILVTALVAGSFYWRKGSAPIVAIPKIAAAPAPVAMRQPSTIFAGRSGVPGYVDGRAEESQFRAPNGVAIDPSGNVFVSDTGNNVIREISLDGVVRTIAGKAKTHGTDDGPGDRARFWAPFGIATDLAGNVYVADTDNNTIRKISTNGIVSTIAGQAGHAGIGDGVGLNAQFRNPWSLAVDKGGIIFVADKSNNTIRKIGFKSIVTTVAGEPQKSGHRDGIGANTLFNDPTAIAVDGDGNVYVADSGNNVIRKITPERIVSTIAGLPGYAGNLDGKSSGARFGDPSGIAVDQSGIIYVSDSANNALRRIVRNAEVTVVVFSGLEALNHPGGLSVDTSGNVYVADTRNHLIRKIPPSRSQTL